MRVFERGSCLSNNILLLAAGGSALVDGDDGRRKLALLEAPLHGQVLLPLANTHFYGDDDYAGTALQAR